MFNALEIESSVNIDESVRHGADGYEFAAGTDGERREGGRVRHALDQQETGRVPALQERRQFG